MSTCRFKASMLSGEPGVLWLLYSCPCIAKMETGFPSTMQRMGLHSVPEVASGGHASSPSQLFVLKQAEVSS